MVAALVSFTMPIVHAAPLSGARITHIVNDVRTIGTGESPRASALNEWVDAGKAVRTGIASRTELLFGDQTITRIGANSHFTFRERTREISLSRGVILLQVPKGAGGAKVETAAVTAAITGTTILFEAGPVFTKLIVFEGKCFLTPKAGRLHRKVAVTEGQQVIMPNGATEVPAPAAVDLNALVKTSPLIAGKWGAKLDQTHIAAAIALQRSRQSGEIGRLSVNGVALVNKKPARNGDIIRAGDVVQTGANQTARIALNGGGEIAIEKSTRVRIGGGGNEPITTNVVFGRVETRGLNNTPDDADPDAYPLPYLASFGFANFPIGVSASAGGVVSVVQPGGSVAFFDGLGRLIGSR